MNLAEADDLKLISLAILRGIVPTVSAEEINSIRLVHKNSLHNLAKPTFLSIIVKITSVARTRQIFANKKDRNYYSTKDIDRSVLHEDF